MIPLIENLDYYIENGRWVFTAHYLQSRGYCCGSGCRHCPYPKEETDKKDDNSPVEPKESPKKA